jgi:hypothetical protein
MKVDVELEQEDFDAMHDVIFEVMGTEPSNEEIKAFWDLMPEDIKGTAIQWGCSDSVFRDNMYEWLEKFKAEYK